MLCRIKVGEWRLLNQGHILRLASHFRTVGPGAAGSGAAENRVLAAASVSRLNSPEETGQQGADQRQSKTSGLEEERVTVEKNVETPNVLIPEVSAVDVEFSGPLPLIFPDESLDEVLRWAGDWTVLPVVNRADLGKLEGILTLAGILRAFRSAAAE